MQSLVEDTFTFRGIELRSILYEKLVQEEKNLHTKACQTCKFLSQVDLCKFIVQVS